MKARLRGFVTCSARFSPSLRSACAGRGERPEATLYLDRDLWRERVGTFDFLQFEQKSVDVSMKIECSIETFGKHADSGRLTDILQSSENVNICTIPGKTLQMTIVWSFETLRET